MVRSRLSSRAVFWLACGVTCLLSACWLAPAAAQVPSAEQLEIFQNLPADQQQAILESLGRGDASGMPSSRPRADRQLKFPETIRPRSARDGEDAGFDEDDLSTGVPREPRLKGNDTVLLTLEIRQLERLAPEIEERQRQEREQARTQVTLPTQPVIPGRQQATPAADSAGQTQRAIERTGDELDELGDFRERVLRRNPYKLDKWGILNIAELGPIPLGGYMEIGRASCRERV